MFVNSFLGVLTGSYRQTLSTMSEHPKAGDELERKYSHTKRETPKVLLGFQQTLKKILHND